MTLTLPETLLLFGLHDDKGTVHSAAYLALDPALRGAAITELKLRGHVQIRAAGDVRWNPTAPPPPALPFLRTALEALKQAPAPAPVSTWLAALAVEVPDLRGQIQTSLERRGILGPPDSPTSNNLVPIPVVDPSVEQTLKREVNAALDDGEAISPRLGSLVGLTVACHLGNVVFGDRADAADGRAAWVADRDSVLRAVVESIMATEGM